MNITTIKRPWMKSVKQGTRYNPDPFYHSQTWARTKAIHKQGFTIVDGVSVSNMYCIPCYRETKLLVPMHTVDHIIAIKLGGSRTDSNNLESQCKTHHARKSANEGKRQATKQHEGVGGSDVV